MNKSAINAIAINGSIYAHLAAEAGIEFSPALELIYGNTLAGDAYLEVTAEAEPVAIPVVMRKIDGSVEIAVQIEISESLSVSVSGQADASVVFDAMGYSTPSRAAFIEAVANISVTAQAERYGRPAITSEYMPAHRPWQMQVQREDVTFMVPRDDWGNR